MCILGSCRGCNGGKVRDSTQADTDRGKAEDNKKVDTDKGKVEDNKQADPKETFQINFQKIIAFRNHSQNWKEPVIKTLGLFVFLINMVTRQFFKEIQIRH